MHLLICLVTILTLSFPPQATATLRWDAESRTPIRSQILNCEAFLSPADPKPSDGIGIALGGSDLRQIKEQLLLLKSSDKAEALIGAVIFVTGVSTGEQEQRKKSELEDLLREIDLTSIEVRILSAPPSLIEERAIESLKEFNQRLRYFFPSLKRDYQEPTLSELKSGAVNVLLVEASALTYLYSNLSFTDASVTLAVHALLVGSMQVYAKSIYNWLLRPGTGRIEGFLKGVLFSVPFVANYNITTRFTEIISAIEQKGISQVASTMPEAFAEFAATQSITLVLQTLFYYNVITYGVRGWEASVQGVKDSEDARTLANYVTIPILMTDAYLLAMAGAGQNVLFSFGPMSINTGHVGLTLLTVAGSSLWIWPKTLDPVLRGYQACKSFAERCISHFHPLK